MKSDRRRSAAAWGMWGILIFTYMFNTFHAVAMGVIRGNLIDDFGLSENSFVLLTNMFSYAYMFMQIPAGILLDRFGAKRVSVGGALLTAAGTALFAAAPGFGMLLLGRTLIGIGCSVSFLSVLKISSEWFDDRVFCTMSGVTCFVGMMGAMAAQAPMAALSERVAWPLIYRGIVIFILVITVLVILFVRDRPEQLGFEPLHPLVQNTVSLSVTMKAVANILRNPHTWAPAVSYAFFYGTYVIITGLYGSSMLESFYHVGSVQASGVVTCAVLGCAVGSVAVDLLADRTHLRRKPEILFGALYVCVWLLLFLMMGRNSIALLYPMMFLFGLASTAYAVCWSAVKECNNPAYVGVSTAVANMGGYFGSILVPTISGQIYTANISAGTPAAFRAVLLGGAVMSAVGLAACFGMKETFGKNIWVDGSRRKA